LKISNPFLRAATGSTCTVTMNRPQRRNALSLELMRELIDCLDRFGAERHIRAIILAAEGRVFSSGHDLSEMVGRGAAEYRELFDVCTRLMTKIQSVPQPVIAQVQGIATAAGCQLVAACDLAIACEDAAFATPGVNIGLFCTTPMVALTRVLLTEMARHRCFSQLRTPAAVVRGQLRRSCSRNRSFVFSMSTQPPDRWLLLP